MNSDAKNTDEYLKTLPEWQAKNLADFRKHVHKIVPDVTEEIKWGVPVFLSNGKILFAMSNFKAHTKYNFYANGAQLADPKKLFNNGFDSKRSRGIDLREGESVNLNDLEDLIKDAFSKL